MKILVCIKQVPDSTAHVKVDGDGRDIETAEIAWSISPYDEFAVEFALEHKDNDAATEVVVASVGPPRAKDALRHALAMGCDRAVLVTGEVVEHLDAYATVRALATIVQEEKPDLVLCGRQASDDDQGFVGIALAEELQWPHVTNIARFATAEHDGLEVWKQVEGGHEVWHASLPAVLAVQKSTREPRYPTLPAVMKAKRKAITERGLPERDDSPRITLERLEIPPARGGGTILSGQEVAQMAQQLASLLRQAKVV